MQYHMGTVAQIMAMPVAQGLRRPRLAVAGVVGQAAAPLTVRAVRPGRAPAQSLPQQRVQAAP